LFAAYIYVLAVRLKGDNEQSDQGDNLKSNFVSEKGFLNLSILDEYEWKENKTFQLRVLDFRISET
jgi:hypothetical protein